MAGGGLREMVLVVPGNSDDIYLRHQQVWQVMGQHARQGQDFIFTQEDDPQFFRVRSDTLPRWAKPTALPRQGRFEIDMVCAIGEGYRDAVPEAELPAWSAEKLARHGLAASAVQVQRMTLRRGIKRVRDTDRVERIVVPVARLIGDYRVAHPVLAQEAFRCGVGRGKRFGFGFLRVAA